MKNKRCICGSLGFRQVDNHIECCECGKILNDTEDVGFFTPSDNKIKQSFVKLGMDVGVEAATVGANYLVGVVAPWALPFTLSALGIIINKSGDVLSDIFMDKFFIDSSYGKKLESILESELKSILKKGKKENSKYYSFVNYHNYCSLHYSNVLSYLLTNGVNTDIYSEEAIIAIISDEFNYPGREDSGVLKSVLETAKELHCSFEEKVCEDKNIGPRWLIEKNRKELQKAIELLHTEYVDDSIDDATFEYIQNYKRPLFLENNSNITLGKMYLEPIDQQSKKTAIEIINDWYCSKDQLLFVFGAAGIGKTSLVTKIINDVYGISGDNNILGIGKDEIHPIILRDHIHEFASATQIEGFSALNIIVDILKIKLSKLNGHLIILDGFDELYVLSKEFKYREFIKKLIKDLRSTNIKVLITLRPIKEIYNMPDFNRIELVWKKNQIKEWCEKFKDFTVVDEEKKWCNDFTNSFFDMIKNNPNDNRLEMFSVPIILYLACKSNTVISEYETIGKFYDNAFRNIIERKYSEFQKSSGVFEDVKHERLMKLINWQLTKELAYQMYLSNDLILTNNDGQGNDRIKWAKDRTIIELRKHFDDIPDNCEIDDKLYLAVSYFANNYGEEKGIEFAHKTVYEYFTAVKLYEDYFSRVNEDFLKNMDSQKCIKEIWNNIIEAFRYKGVGNETTVFNYLNEMTRAAYDGTEKNTQGLDFELFEKYYIEGMEQDILCSIGIPPATLEYSAHSKSTITVQIECAFRNLTWFLTGHGFKNEEKHAKCRINKDLIANLDNNYRVNCTDWELERAELKNTTLRNSIFNNANLESANLNSSNLSNSNFEEADLKNVNMKNSALNMSNLSKANMKASKLNYSDLSYTNLRRTNLNGADLSNALFEGADLREADLTNTILDKTDFKSAILVNTNLKGTNLEKANLQNATYCLDPDYATIFPNDFDPSIHGMIEVDKSGNRIEK